MASSTQREMKDTLAPPRSGTVLFFWLLLASVIGTLIGVPWVVSVTKDSATAWQLAGSSVLQLLPACAVGVWLGPKVGLGSELRPLVSRAPGAWRAVGAGFVPGTLVGVVMSAVVLLGVSSMPRGTRIPGLEDPTIFEVFLRCLSAGIVEEITFRFGLMTLLAWIVKASLTRPADDATSQWVGNVLAALLFGAAHLPGLPAGAWIPALLIPIVTVNAGAAIAMGWLFLRYGLVSAICAHTVADVVQAVVPRLVSLMG